MVCMAAEPGVTVVGPLPDDPRPAITDVAVTQEARSLEAALASRRPRARGVHDPCERVARVGP